MAKYQFSGSPAWLSSSGSFSRGSIVMLIFLLFSDQTLGGGGAKVANCLSVRPCGRKPAACVALINGSPPSHEDGTQTPFLCSQGQGKSLHLHVTRYPTSNSQYFFTLQSTEGKPSKMETSCSYNDLLKRTKF